MTDRRLPTELLLEAGRLLLEYNESTAAIHRALTTTAAALTGEPCRVLVSYRGLAVSIGGGSPDLIDVGELHYNTAVQARVHRLLADVRAGQLDAASTLARLRSVEAETPRHSRWLACVALGAAAACLARLLGADGGGLAVVGVATAVGLFARQELGRLHFSLLALPFTAALIGAVAGGLAVRLGWTRSPDLAVVVPALMVIPGPHLINGLLDLIDNHLPMSLARLGLAAGILLAGAAGVAHGAELSLPDLAAPDRPADPGRLTFITDAALAGVVTCGFAVFYNTTWRVLGMATVGGMTGHGVRFLALEAGAGLLAATVLGGLTVGAIAALLARRFRTPVAVIAFAGAVTMIPGLSLYRALAGALWLARLPDLTDAGSVTATLSNALQAGLVIGGLTLGLAVGASAVLALVGDQDAPTLPRVGTGHQSDRVSPATRQEVDRSISRETARGHDR
jgi:uncharacterized membrane protein YjjP (DUF1212 family)